MPRTREQLQNTLLKRDNAHNYRLSVWIGADEATAVKLLNKDNLSAPKVVQTRATNEMLIQDTSVILQTDIYKVSWVHDDEPDANAPYWLSRDEGVTKIKLKFMYKEERSLDSFWWIFLKRG